MVFIAYSFVYSVTLLFCIKSVILFSSSSSGTDTLRFLGLATVDVPGPKEEMNLDDPENFVQYEVQMHVHYM